MPRLPGLPALLLPLLLLLPHPSSNAAPATTTTTRVPSHTFALRRRSRRSHPAPPPPPPPRGMPGMTRAWRLPLCSWTNVDSCDATTKGRMASSLRNSSTLLMAARQNALDMLRLRPGYRVVDVGCGVGADTAAIARRLRSLGGGGEVVGADSSATMIGEARRGVDTAAFQQPAGANPESGAEAGAEARAEAGAEAGAEANAGHGAGSPGTTSTGPRSIHTTPPAAGVNVSFSVTDGLTLASSLGRNHFDLAHVSRVLQHMEDPGALLRQIMAAVRPGGHVVAIEPDWGSVVVDHPNPRATTTMLRLFEQTMPSPWIGRRLRGVFLRAGLSHVAVRAVTVVTTVFETSDLEAQVSI